MKKLTRYQSLVVCICLSSVITFANIYWLQPLLPVLQNHFIISSMEANFAMSAPLLGMGVGLLIFASISDSIGRCAVLLTGIALGLCFSLMLPRAEDYNVFLLLRFLQGTCLAACPAVAVPLLADELRKSWLPAAVGFYIASNTLGGLASRLIAGVGAEYFEYWAAGGYIIAGLSTILFFVIFSLLPKQRHFKAEVFNFKSCTMNYVEHIGKIKLVLVYLIICAGFGCFVNLTNYMMMVLDQAPYNMPSDIRSMMFLTLLGGTTSSSLAGKFAKKHSQIAGVATGILIMLFSILLMSGEEMIFLVSGMILLAVGFFFCHANASALIGKSVKKAKGSAQALYSLFYYSGASFGVLYFEPSFLASGWQGVLVSSGLALMGAMLLLAIYQLVVIREKRAIFYKVR